MEPDATPSATALLGMEGFVVLAQEERDGEWWLAVETTADRARCPACGGPAVGHGRAAVTVRDLTMAGRPVVLVWNKRVWRCPAPACPKRTWREHHGAIGPRRCLTERARAEICRRVGADEDSVAACARDYGVGWHTAMAAVKDHGAPRVCDPSRLEGVEAVGLDESLFLAATPERRTRYATAFVDLDRSLLLDVVPDRSAGAVGAWLSGRPAAWLGAVSVVAIDPHRGYHRGLVSHLPHATVVVDHFHAVRLANDAIDDVRRRVQQETLGHRGRKGDPLYGIRRLLLRGAERLSPRAWERIFAGLAAGDPHGEVGAALLAKELLREAYAAASLHEARRRLVAFYQWCAQAEVPELVRLARTISAWEDEVLAYHTTGCSNGRTEAMNFLVDKIRRIGHGFRNFDNYRLRLLLRCGVKWHTHRTARVRARKPSLVA